MKITAKLRMLNDKLSQHMKAGAHFKHDVTVDYYVVHFDEFVQMLENDLYDSYGVNIYANMDFVILNERDLMSKLSREDAYDDDMNVSEY